MTRSDRWKKRKCVLEYWAFKDELRLKLNSTGFFNDCPNVIKILFEIKMPKSWSEKKKSEMLGHPHQQKPDVDNCLKGMIDSVYHEDKFIHSVNASKVWGREGSITIWW